MRLFKPFYKVTLLGNAVMKMKKPETKVDEAVINISNALTAEYMIIEHNRNKHMIVVYAKNDTLHFETVGVMSDER